MPNASNHFRATEPLKAVADGSAEERGQLFVVGSPGMVQEMGYAKIARLSSLDELQGYFLELPPHVVQEIL